MKTVVRCLSCWLFGNGHKKHHMVEIAAGPSMEEMLSVLEKETETLRRSK